jgi:putative (di)nucleoside polyphosphate hydrolase
MVGVRCFGPGAAAMMAGSFRKVESKGGNQYLLPEHVEVIGHTQKWLRYDVPRAHIRSQGMLFRGQKQMWYLLHMLADDNQVCLDHAERPEFDEWRWVDYWQPLKQIVSFKRRVYRRALTELEPMVIRIDLPT